jgi:hypothetical protein
MRVDDPLNLTGSNDLHSYRESRCYTEIAMELFCSVGVLSAWRTARVRAGETLVRASKQQ